MASSAQKIKPTPAGDFEEALTEEFGSDQNPKKMLARDILAFVTKQIEAKPDYTPGNGGGFALSESGVIPYQGALIRQDQIYNEFPGEEREVREALDWLHHGKADLLDGEWVDYSWLIKPVFRPDPELDKAVIQAREMKKAAKKGKTSKHPGLKNPPFAPLSACNVLAGRDLRAGVLLHQIRYWYDKAYMWHGGKRWIVKPSVEWCAETVLSRSQYGRALAKLKGRRIVETEQHLTTLYKSGDTWKNITHLRPLFYVGVGPAYFTSKGGKL